MDVSLFFIFISFWSFALFCVVIRNLIMRWKCVRREKALILDHEKRLEKNRKAMIAMRAESQNLRWKEDPAQYLRDVEQGRLG